MIKKISDKDKQDWENFLKNKQKTPNREIVKKKNLINKKTIEISDKDKKDWENFLRNKEKIPNKDFVYKKKYKA